MNAIGIIEVSGVVAAAVCTDAMLKTANIKILTNEKKLGGRLVTIIISGDTSSVKEAIENGEKAANTITKTASKALINRPHEEIIKLIEKSSSKYN